MRALLYRLFNFFTGLIPPPILRRMLRALHVRPELADRVGYQVHPQAFYNPFPDPREVDVARLRVKRSLPGVNLKLDVTRALMPELAKYAAEVKQFLEARQDVARWDQTYPVCDTGTLYAMLRHLKPKRYIEVGCGFSSQASAAALRRNEAEGHRCQTVFIEPYPPPYLDSLNLPGQFIAKKVQDVSLEVFTQLGAGDVLFIDTSHVIKVQNDVEFELIHVLPSLKAGVFVHVHDILTPYDYPEEWLVGTGPNRGGANEQYALECLLSGGGDWEVILPVHLLWKEQRELLKTVADADGRPAAFWMRKVHLSGPF
jgi:hypothetical protein